MDSQQRIFKDYLLLYNRVTELCFANCVDNFFTRELNKYEESCVDKCVSKFTKFNQSIMAVYVEVQSDINVQRMKELEATEAAKNAVSTTTSTDKLGISGPVLSGSVQENVNTVS